MHGADYKIKEMKKSFPGESSMLCWFLKESEICHALTSQGTKNIHSTTEESSEDVFSIMRKQAIQEYKILTSYIKDKGLLVTMYNM